MYFKPGTSTKLAASSASLRRTAVPVYSFTFLGEDCFVDSFSVPEIPVTVSVE